MVGFPLCTIETQIMGDTNVYAAFAGTAFFAETGTVLTLREAEITGRTNCKAFSAIGTMILVVVYLTAAAIETMMVFIVLLAAATFLTCNITAAVPKSAVRTFHPIVTVIPRLI